MTYPKCVLCLPFSSTAPDRIKAFQETYKYYTDFGYNVFIGDSDPFSRSSARNGSVPDLDSDILVFLDADIIVPYQQLQDAITTAFKKQVLVLAYTDLFVLDKEQTSFYYNHKYFCNKWKQTYNNQISGAFAVPKSLWVLSGGYDERFKGWGGEDRAFYHTCSILQKNIECQRIQGSAYHLFHDRSSTENFSFLSENPLLKHYQTVLELSDRFTLQSVPSKNRLLKVLKEDNAPLDSKKVSKGFLSCPSELLSVLPYSRPSVQNPLIGVTISCFKSRHTVKRAVVSALNQTSKKYMIFVVSDGDDTVFEELKDLNHKRLLFLRSPTNIGRYAIDHLLCTHVLPMFGCKYWAPLDSDDIVDKNWLKKMLKKIGTSSVVFTDQLIVTTKGTMYVEKVKPYTGDKKLFWSAHLGGLWNLKFVLENNLTNPKYRVAWDTIMTLVPWLIGNVEVIEEPLYTRIKSYNSLTFAKETNFKSQYRKEVTQDLENIWAVIQRHPNHIHEILRKSRWKTKLF